MAETVTLSQITVKRLIKDVKEIMKNPLTSQGIYYQHDEADLLKGYAMIIGPSDTPYFGGYYFFTFDFPKNYPFAPPVVQYHTNDGVTRFNPNLYKNGKVCVSVLNTWMGEQWTVCQTISSVLLTICTLLCKNPLLNEPGIKETDADIVKYNQIIEYKNISIAICEMINRTTLFNKQLFDRFYPHMVSSFMNNFDNILNWAVNLAKKYPKNYIQTNNIYHMTIMIDFASMPDMLNEIKGNLEQLAQSDK